MELEKIIVKYGADISELKKQLEDVKKSTTGIETEAKSLGNTVSTKLNSAFSTLGATIAAAFAVERIGSFISSSIELAAQAEGIKRAFDRLNDPTLLSNLREATKGTVSDLNLMKTAVKAANFKLPLDQLAKYLKFAQQRAIETGESIDNLVESIVLGISRKSIPIIDNLGISAQQVQEEFQKTGDFAKAVGNIIDESMKNAADSTLTVAEKQAQLRAEIENTKVEIGNGLLPVLNTFLTGFAYTLQNVTNLISDSSVTTIKEETAAMEKRIQMYKEYGDKIRETSISIQKDFIEDVGKLNFKSFEELEAFAIKTKKVYLDGVKNASEYRKEAVRLAVQGIDAYVNSQREADDITPKVTEKVEKQKDAVWGLGYALGVLAKQFNTLSSERSIETFGVDVDATADAIIKARTELDKLIKLTPLAAPAVENAAEDSARAWYDSWEYYGTQLTALWDGISSFFRSQEEGKLALLQSRLDQGLISEKQYNDQVKDVQREQAKRDKLLAVFNVLADTPAAIVQGLSQGGPAGAVLAAAIAAVQLGTALALDIPQFKTGVIDFKGKGTETSDSNLVMISKGESVINAKSTKKHRDILEAINKDRFEQYMANKYKGDVAIGWDDYRLLLELKKGTQASRENTKQIVKAIEKRPHRF